MKTLLAAATVILLWASGFVGIKLALRELSPGQLALARYAVASLVFLLLLVGRRVAVPRAPDLLRLALVGGFGISLYNLLLNYGQRTVSVGIASLLVGTAPIWTSLFAIAWLRERIGRRAWIGTMISFTGIALIGLHRSGWGGFESGTLLVLGAAISQALYFVIAKPLLKRYHPIDLTSYASWFGCLLLIPFGSGLGSALQAASAPTIGAIVFLGVGPAALAYVAWSYVLAALPAGKASNILFLVPVVALILGWLVLGEMPAAVALIGGAITIFGLLIRGGVFKRLRADAVVGPTIDPTAFVAPNALVDGQVTIGAGSRIMYGAQVIAESGSITIGSNVIVLENAVLRSSARHPLRIGDHCLVGPNAHVVGCTVEDEVFIATGAAVFHGAHLGQRSEVRINGVVHIRTRLADGAIVPIGHVAVGDPARVFPPSAHEEIWRIQEPLDFPGTVYGIRRSEASMEGITRHLSESST